MGHRATAEIKPSNFVLTFSGKIMKVLPFACLALALAGCSQTPSDGEIGRYIEPLFASCENIKLADVSKTNGHGEANGYLVEFSYEIEVDSDKLDQMRGVYIKEKEQSDTYARDSKSYQVKKQELEEAIGKRHVQFQRDNPMPVSDRLSQSSQFSPEYLEAQHAAHQAVYDAWKLKRDEDSAQLTAELAALDEAWKARYADTSERRFSNPASIANDINTFYQVGCAHEAGRFMFGMLGPKVQDQVEFFDRKHMKMNGKLTMRKTEQGWRVI
jgi:hypothetical protein